MIINFLTPLITDDFYYSMIGDKHISSLKDIFDFQVAHYFGWGGRTIAHTIAQLFLLYPKSVFNIFNSIINAIEVFLIYKIAQGNKKSNPLILVIIFLLIWYCLPVYGVSNIWLIGSCNYLWTTVIILLFLLQYQKDRKDNIKNIVIMLLFGIVAGWTNENISFGCIVTIISIIIMEKINKNKIKKWQIFGLIGNIIGFAILILSPGNFVRSSLEVEESSFFKTIISRFLTYSENVVNFLLPLIILLTIIISIYIYKKQKIDKRIYPYLLGSFFSIYSMLLSPQFPERAWTGVVILLIIPIIILIYDIRKISRIVYITIIDLIIIGLFVFTKEYIQLFRDTNVLRITWIERKKEIQKVKKVGKQKLNFIYIIQNLKGTHLINLMILKKIQIIGQIQI